MLKITIYNFISTLNNASSTRERNMKNEIPMELSNEWKEINQNEKCH